MGAIRVKGGCLVDPFDLTEDDVRNVDFIHALSCINRYTGHAKYPYSVGQHTYVLVKHVPKGLRRAAFVHDFAEVFFNDLASPVKHRFASYKKYEKEAMKVIASVFEVGLYELEAVKPYDHSMYIDERNVLFDRISELGMGDERTGLGVDPWFLRERQWRDVAMDLYRMKEELFDE